MNVNVTKCNHFDIEFACKTKGHENMGKEKVPTCVVAIGIDKMENEFKIRLFNPLPPYVTHGEQQKQCYLHGKIKQ